MAKFENNVRIVGTLEDVNLEVKEYKNKSTNEPYQAIVGDYTIKTGDQNINLRAFYMDKFKSGKTNGNFTIAQRWIDNPDDFIGKTYSVNTTISENAFLGQDGNVVKATQIQAGFLSDRNVGAEKAEFLIDALIESDPIEELQNDEPTGRYFLTARIFDFRDMCYPTRFVIDKPQAYDYFINLGASKSNPILLKLWGKVINNTIEHIREVESAFGEPLIETSVTTRRENVITGGSTEPRDITDEDYKTIKDGIAAYEVRIAELQQPRTEGFGNTSSGVSAPKATKKSFDF